MCTRSLENFKGYGKDTSTKNVKSVKDAKVDRNRLLALRKPKELEALGLEESLTLLASFYEITERYKSMGSYIHYD
eukprot:8724439-Pyramimonas_sp.AAC.1